MGRRTFIDHIGPGNIKKVGKEAMINKANELGATKGVGTACIHVNSEDKDLFIFAINNNWRAVYDENKRFDDCPGVGANLEGFALGKLAQTGRTNLPSTCNPETHFDFGECSFPGSTIIILRLGNNTIKLSASFSYFDDSELDVQVAEAGVSAMTEMVENIWDNFRKLNNYYY